MRQTWEDYLRVSPDLVDRHAADADKHVALTPLREVIAHVAAMSAPARVACIGAGVLNDIPYHMLVRSGAELFLVDWLPSLVDAGLPYAALELTAEGQISCAYCTLSQQHAAAYCRHFAGNTQAGVCASFCDAGKGRPACAAYVRGTTPKIRTEDATQGFAVAFAGAVPAVLKRSGGWRDALREAQAAVRDATRQRVPLGIESASIDLVISSMIISQFEHEPYAYFLEQAAAVLGPPSARDERRLDGLAGNIHVMLRRVQLERHIDEITRILAPNGRCFIAIELFQRKPEGDWFWVEAMEETVAMLTKRFDLDLDLLPPGGGMVRIGIGEQPSFVLCLVLRHKRP